MYFRFFSAALLLCLSSASFAQQPAGRCPDAADLFKDRQIMLERVGGLMQPGTVREADRYISCLLRTEQRFPSGHTGSGVVYEAFRRRFRAPGTGLPEKQLVEAWKQAVPGSIYAEFAELRYQFGASWSARGGCSARCTPEESMAAFAAGLLATEASLQRASGPLKETALWNELLLSTALDSPRGKSDPVALFNADVERWPRNFEFHELVLTRLVPKWGGDWNTVDGFIRSYGESLKASEGDTLYARLYASVAARGEPMRETKIDWPRMKASLDELVQRYPDAGYRNVAASFACVYGDGAYFRTAMARAGDEAYGPGWLEGTSAASCTRALAPSSPK